jgi:tagatose-1,6-bisphosphate aldolase non-catalytic subunit AgaZ/GatZ
MTRHDNFRLSALAQFGSGSAEESRRVDAPSSLLCVGCVSPVGVEATLRAAQATGTIAILVASRNQIESPEVGRGYAAPFAQRPLMRFVADAVRTNGISVPVLVCRDHGGPWQRYDERALDVVPATALARARHSLVDDVRAGFRYLHVDMSAARTRLSARELVTTTADLIQACEEERSRGALPAVAYEVSTEHADGGVSTAADLDAFLAPLIATLERRRLPHPTTVVVRCGTVCREGRNAGVFDADAASLLAAHVHGVYGLRMKEHNGDYAPSDELRAHAPAGVDLLNIGPSVGDAETTCLLDLAAREAEVVTPERRSHFRAALLEAVGAAAPVHIWHASASAPPEDVLLATCGHYVFADPAVVRAREVLFANCARAGVVPDPHARVLQHVQTAITAVVRHLGAAC